MILRRNRTESERRDAVLAQLEILRAERHASGAEGSGLLGRPRYDAAIGRLTRMRHAAVPTLLSVLDQARPEAGGVETDITEDIIEILGTIGDRRAVPALRRLLGDTTSAAEALCRMSDPAGSHALLEALADPDARVRMHVTDGLGYSRVRSSDQAAALLLALADPLAHIRVAAAGALSRLGRRDARVLDALRAAAQRDDAQAVRHAARAAHDQLTRP